MTDKTSEELALEQAVIDAVLNCSGFEPSLSVVLQAADKLRDFRAPKPKPRCEPADADKDKPYHWVLTQNKSKIVIEWAATKWYLAGVEKPVYPIELADDGYTYLCIATPPEPKVEPTKEAIKEFVASGWLNDKFREASDIVRETLKHFSLPKPVDLTDEEIDRLWIELMDGHSQYPSSRVCRKFARAVLAAGRRE